MEATTELLTIGVSNIPRDVLEQLRPHAIRASYGATNASVIRYAVVELAKRLTAVEAVQRADDRT